MRFLMFFFAMVSEYLEKINDPNIVPGTPKRIINTLATNGEKLWGGDSK